jgi:SAM-dependent methyltransferase
LLAALGRDLGQHLGRGAWRGRHVALSATDLPEWVRPSDLLAREDDAEEARSLARRLGLPREADPLAAWAALGALAAVLRLRDDGRRRAVVVDGSGSSSPFGRWADALGFTTLETGEPSDLESDAELEPGSVDVLTRLHPGGCDADDVADAMAQASWTLRPGGLLSLTVPVGPTGAHGALGPAEVRGVLARSDDLGFVLVGDLDHDLTGRLRAASAGATVPDAAYGILRLTLRRR